MVRRIFRFVFVGRTKIGRAGGTARAMICSLSKPVSRKATSPLCVRQLPDAYATAERWCDGAVKASLPSPYLCAAQDGGAAIEPRVYGFEPWLSFHRMARA